MTLGPVNPDHRAVVTPREAAGVILASAILLVFVIVLMLFQVPLEWTLFPMTFIYLAGVAFIALRTLYRSWRAEKEQTDE